MKRVDVAGAVAGDSVSMTAGLRAALAGGTAMVVLLAALDPAQAQAQLQRLHPLQLQRLHPLKRAVQTQTKQVRKEPPPKPLQAPLIAISIANQRMTLYDNGVPIAHAPVSTGTPSHPTPMGIFSVIQKEKFHRSNIYSGAPMPYMQRITWSGVAMHAGVLPGYPASHGCIRLPHEFASRLYGLTRSGARVIITRNEIAPVEFEHGRLFVLNKHEPAKIGQAGEPERRSESTHEDWIRTAEGESGVVSDAVAAVAHTLAAISSRKPTVPPVAAGPTDAAPEALAAPAEAAPAPVEPAEPPRETASAPATETPDAEIATGTVLVKPVAVLEPIELRRTFEATGEPFKAAPMTVPAPAPALEAFGPERPLRPGPITVFVSKKEGKVFVRKAFQPVFDAPVKIARPDQPLGTHLFTAVEAKSDGASFRWLAVSLPAEAAKKVEVPTAKNFKPASKPATSQALPSPQTAAQALERIDMPSEALTQISALMSAGASLIISDQGLGPETGLETDFIVLTR